MRGFDFVPPDGGHMEMMHLEAADDEALLAKAVKHAAQYHAGLGLGEDQLRAVIAHAAYDVMPVAQA